MKEKDDDNEFSLKKKKTKSDTTQIFFDCDICGETFTSEKHRNYHRNTHVKESEFFCHICKETFNSNKHLLNHKNIHENEKTCFLCKRCKKAFSDHRIYLCHKIDHLPKPPYKCYECKYQFTKKKSLKMHIYNHYNVELECSVCHKKFQYLKLKQHMNSMHNYTDCVECGKSIKKSTYSYHMAVHTGVKKYQCWYCGQGFSTSSARTVHTRIHIGKKPYKCTICSRSFTQYTDLKTHNISIHQKGVHYECDHCGKRYTLKQSLITHMRLHSNYKPYKCPLCPESFHNSTYLTLHTVTKHIKMNLFNCDMCNVGFKLKAGYKRHLLSKQHRQKEYKYKNIDEHQSS